ncbi:hypothetical protein AB205_0001240, partial [Aquarana catesbeiana]
MAESPASQADSGIESLSLEEILDLYNQPINEEQAWAVCYQCCAALRAAPGDGKRRKITGATEIRIRKDGAVTVRERPGTVGCIPMCFQARFWVQVMRDLRNGVKLKKVQERQYNMLPIEFQLTPYEMLMDDIRSKRYTLRKVMVQGDTPPRLKKSAHEIILDFIRSRPPLNPVSARKLKPTPPRPRSLHERILEEIKSERKLRPVSPDEIRRSRL